MPNYNAAYVYWWIILGSNAPYGQWKYDIVYNNQTYSHFFYIGMTADEDISNKTDIQLFPNPASRQIEINVAGTTKNLQFELYTLSGQVIQTQGINSSRTVMNLNSATGVYFYRIVDSSTDKVEQSGKLVVTE
jgi:hypothetical protein